VSRFRTPAQQREILAKVATGELDVVIGTHRLLQKDVHFKNLGLLIVDEEQRFGVKHKEQLKRMRESIDVLTLTATPIPRTLHTGLVGIREISVIETPPEGRLPIRTYLQPFDDRLVREALLRELDRDGQVYVVHNKVQTIEAMAEHLRSPGTGGAGRAGPRADGRCLAGGVDVVVRPPGIRCAGLQHDYRETASTYRMSTPSSSTTRKSSG